jgi:hypothetical protein
MDGQAKRKLGKELLMAFQRRLGARVAIARGATFIIPAKSFHHSCEIVSSFLRNRFIIPAKSFRHSCETISKQLRNSV